MEVWDRDSTDIGRKTAWHTKFIQTESETENL